MEAPQHPRDRLSGIIQRLSENNPELKTLEIRYAGLEDDEALLLSNALAVNETLRELDLASNLLGDHGTALIAQGMHTNRALKKIILSSNRIRDAAALGTLLRHNNTVKCLVLCHNQLGNDGAAQLSQGLAHNRSLTSLRLNGNLIGAQGAAAIGTALSHHPTLSRLDLTGNPVSGSLCNGLQLNDSLQTVILARCSLSADAGIALATLIARHATLRELYLDNNRLEDDGVEALAAGLNESRSLLTLSLNGNCIRNRGACAIARALAHHPLQYLSLNRNRISNEGVIELARVLRTDTTLKELDLYRNHAHTEAAVEMVDAMHSNATLFKLELSCNCITNVSVMRQIRFFGKLNKAGRHLLRSPHVPIALWPYVLARINYEPHVRFYFLREKPEVFQYYNR